MTTLTYTQLMLRAAARYRSSASEAAADSANRAGQNSMTLCPGPTVSAPRRSADDASAAMQAVNASGATP